MDFGAREVRYSADVVEVEMGDHDMADVIGAEAECCDVVGGGFAAQQPGPNDMAESSDPAGGVVAVMGTEAAVDQDESIVGLDQQDVACNYRRQRSNN